MNRIVNAFTYVKIRSTQEYHFQCQLIYQTLKPFCNRQFARVTDPLHRCIRRVIFCSWHRMVCIFAQYNCKLASITKTLRSKSAQINSVCLVYPIMFPNVLFAPVIGV